MAEETQYGYQDDTVKVSPFNFGLNAGVTFLKTFEWTPTGGKDGAEQEALNIVFDINGTEKSLRMFPVTKAFLKDGGETTDPSSKEFKAEVANFNAKIFHIMHCFVETDVYKTALAKRISSFKDFCNTVVALLPKDFNKKPLDIFLQFQWQPSSGQTRTYLDIPKKMSYGFWLVSAQAGTWTKHAKENPTQEDREALYYMNEKNEKHPFVRNGWFMSSNFAKQQSDDSAEDTSTTQADTAAGEAQNATTATAESW